MRFRGQRHGLIFWLLWSPMPRGHLSTPFPCYPYRRADNAARGCNR